MPVSDRASWSRGELYEGLCVLVTGACVWLIGVELGVFRLLNNFFVAKELTDFVMLGLFMGLAILAASVHKSLKLRQAMTERDVVAKQAEAVARHDGLTGLANRRLFLETVQACLAVPDALPRSAVILVDLDRFKPVNDIYGHAAGNAVLCAVADRLRSLLGGRGLAARLGGDEFGLLVDCQSGVEPLVRLAQSVIASISAPIVWDGNELRVGATVGIADASGDHADADAVLHAADIAMYRAKKDGRGTYRVFRSAMDEELKQRAQMERELRAAIQSDQIEPYYQPVVDLPTKELVGVEVLARWRHPAKGLLGPNLFIGVAEETGMISDLSYRLLRRACLDARTWPTHLQLAINIAPKQFQEKGLADKILAVLTETGFPPHRLEIEVTETALVQDIELTQETLLCLQRSGIRIALDDFGTGYSSLYHLRELKFDKLKIDRSYVDSISTNGERAKLVDAIIKLGLSLGLVTTAEGIETTANLDWLTGQGCNLGQGYLFGAPMPKDAIDSLLAESNLGQSNTNEETIAA